MQIGTYAANRSLFVNVMGEKIFVVSIGGELTTNGKGEGTNKTQGGQ